MTDLITQVRRHNRSLAKAIEGIQDAIEHTSSSWAHWGEYNQWIDSSISFLDSAMLLDKVDKKMEAFSLIRMAYERFFVIRLAMEGYRYFYNYAESKSSIEVKLKRKPNPNVLKVIKRGKNGSRVVFFGRHIDDSQQIIPNYYYAIHEYNPDAAFIGDYRDIGVHWERYSYKHERRLPKTHKKLKNSFFTPAAIVENLKVNGFLTHRQSRAFFVHYNFLSQFVHPIEESLEGNMFRAVDIKFKTEYQKKIPSLLLLVYANHLLKYFYDLKLRYYESQPLTLNVTKVTALNSRVKTSHSPYNFFWFIYNKPDNYSRFNYAVSRISNDRCKKIYSSFTDIPDAIIPYYRKPLSHFADSLIGWSNKGVGTYSRPEIIDSF